MKTEYRLILALTIILIPQTLLANAGTALMWMPYLQLILGNILIGIVEGIFIALIFKTKCCDLHCNDSILPECE